MSSDEQIAQAAQHILNHEVVGMPTETVYGLAARIDSELGIAKIFATKERPFFDPLIVHVNSIKQAQDCTREWSAGADVLANHFWPGPLTLVLPKADQISHIITSGLDTVGLRWPNHACAQKLIEAVGSPLAAPSANKFGRTSPTTAQHVRNEFKDSVFVIESEPSKIGIESTVLSVKTRIDNNEMQYDLSLLRKGSVLKSQIDQLMKQSNLGYRWKESTDKKEAPGQLKHHYMPSIPLVICQNDKIKLTEVIELLNQKLNLLPDEVEGVKMIKPKGLVKKIEFLNLPDDANLAARELYAQLRKASQRSAQAICYIPSKKHTGEMWDSIFDRLYKAASLVLS